MSHSIDYSLSSVSPSVSKRTLLFISTIVVLIVLYLTYSMAQYGEVQMRNSLQAQASILSKSLSSQDIELLKTTPEDMDKAPYLEISARLQAVKKSTPNIHFAYLMKRENGKVVFVADGETKDSPYISLPGEVYPDATSQLLSVFDLGIPVLEGPLKDSYGVFVSALSPIKNAQGEVIAVAGIDIDAKQWQKMIEIYKYSGLLICALMLGLIIMAFFLLNTLQQWQLTKHKLELLETTDVLTDLPNIVYAKKFLMTTLLGAMTAQKTAVLMIKLGGLKKMYDKHGFEMTTQIVRELSHVMSMHLSENDCFASIGQGEFLAILSNVRDATDAEDIAQQIQTTAIQLASKITNSAHKITCNIGISIYPEHGKTAELLLAQASNAMSELRNTESVIRFSRTYHA